MIQFKSIKLVGFKSFADPTEINLSDGVTCIVGPNGCGKSNVADAIRWVLGEQSAKQMRGTQMMDVIFNGTEKRKKMSFCEVTLTFDNTNRIFDIDTDEVEMTRRLYRDGESEYILNRQPSRMKVLTALLHGAGAAKEGYSIIGQGRIAQIMNSRPEERRSIFEEATGIIVFKDRKADAERKLAAARDNLFVFIQRMQEVERQLNPLAKAAENALKYRELYSNLRHHEINTYIYRHDTAEGERGKINSKIKSLTDEINKLAEQSSSLLKEYDECRSLIASADGKLKALNDKRVSYSVGIAETSGESKVFKEKANAVKQKLQQAQEGLQDFIDNGADVSKINIGIAAYGRPVNGSPYWAVWRDLEEANYWNSKYYTVHDSNQVYEGTFCSPALAGDKTAYALFSGCGGVMVFRVGTDKLMSDQNSVACGIENALHRYFTEW